MQTVFRVASHSHALWKVPNRRPARFHSLGDPPTQYASLHPLTAWAEILRSSGASRAELRPDAITERVWALRLELDGLVKLDLENANSFGLSAEQLVSDDQTACRDLGRRLRRDGHTGVIFPSSALPGTFSICLFGERYEAPYLADPVAAVDIPAAAAAERAGPLAALIALVRLRGEPHAGLDAFERGESFRFSEPDMGFTTGVR